MSSADRPETRPSLPDVGAQRETDAFLRAILECADYAIITAGPDGLIRTFNRAAERMLGYRAEEVIGKAGADLLHDAAEVARRAAELTAELGRPVPVGIETFVAKTRLGLAEEHEWTYIRKDGSRLPVQLSVTAMRDDAGQVIGFMGIAHDISRRRTAQVRVAQLAAELEQRVQTRTVELAASEQRYETLATNAPVGIYHCDQTGRCSYVNQHWCHITGYRLEDALGEGWACAVHPEDRRRVLDEWVRTVREEQPFQMEYRYRTPRGKTVWVHGQAVAERGPDGRIVSYVGTITDITESKTAQMALTESERRFRGTFEQAAVGVSHVGLDGRWLLVNDRLCELVGYTRTELMARTFQDITHPDDLTPDLDNVRRLLAGELPHYAMDKRYFHKSGAVVWVRLTVSLLRAADGAPLYFIAIIQDIGKRKRAELITATFAEMGRELGGVDTRRAAAEVIMAAIDRLLSFDALLLHLLTEDRQRVFRVLMVDTQDGQRVEQPAEEVALEPSAMFQRVMARGAQLILRREPGQTDTPLEPFGDQARISASLMFVPIRAGEQMIGVLSVQSYTPRAYEADSVELLQSLADYAGTGLARVGSHVESERLSRLLQETQRVARLGCFEGNLLTGMDHWSDEAYRQMGYAPGEVTASLPNFLARVHREDRERIAAGIARIMRDGQAYESEHRVVLPDGTVRHIHSAVAAEVNPDGRVVRVFGAAQDITHQKHIEAELRQSHAELERRVGERTAELARANMLLFSEVEDRKAIETALRDSKARLRTIIDSTPDLIFIKDRQHRYTMVNEGYTRAIGLAAEDILGKNDLEIGFPAELVHGDPAQGIRGYLADDREVMETGVMKIIAEEPGFMGGEPVYHSTVKVPLRDALGNITGVLGYARDITERKMIEAELRHREEQLRDLFENATDLIQSVAPDGHLLFVNRAWLNTLGYRMADLATLTIFDILHPDCLAGCREQFLRVMRGEAITGMQAIFRSKDGQKIHVDGSASCRFEDGKPVATRAIFRDISKRKAVEEERERLILELQAALAEVKTLSGLLPVCGWCKKIRDDSGYWDSVEGYLKKSSGVDITHGICPECSAKMMVDLEQMTGPG